VGQGPELGMESKRELPAYLEMVKEANHPYYRAGHGPYVAKLDMGRGGVL